MPYLYEREGTNCENLPETHVFLKRLRAFVEKHYPEALLLAEANQWPEDVVAYFGDGDEFQMCYHFPIMPRLFMAIRQEDRRPIVEILERTPAIPPNCQWSGFQIGTGCWKIGSTVPKATATTAYVGTRKNRTSQIAPGNANEGQNHSPFRRGAG